MKFKSLLAASAAAALALAGCSNGSTTSDTSSDSTTSSGGSVYYLNFKPESDQAWKDLAAKYTEETGVEVIVSTAASNDYETRLTSEMGKSGAPTMFQVNGPIGLLSWKDYCYNLYGTPVFDQLNSDSYALYTEDDYAAAIAYCVESYGIIVNTKLLQEAGYTTEDIKNYDDLKSVAEDISSRAGELGFTAFTSSGTDDSSVWRYTTHLANLPIYFEYQDRGITSTDAIEGTYLDNYRDIFDLYINNATVDGSEISAKTADDSRAEFLNGEAVFYQNGSWEYSNLVGEGTGLGDDDITMIPIYIGVGNQGDTDDEFQGLCTGTENYWAVNKDASEADIQATLDFMYWCVTSDEGTTAMADDMGLVIPFKDAKPSPNVFVQEDVKLTENGAVPVAWAFSTIPSDQWKSTLASTLTKYAADPTDANWDQVKSAFVDGWAAEYAKLDTGE